MSAFKFLGILSMVSAVAACGTSQDPSSPPCQFPDGKCEAGEDEVGQNEPGELASGECSSNASNIKTGLKHQCEGELQMGFEFSYGQDGCYELLAWPPCDQHYSFGFEDYVNTQVMACCGAWDGSEQQAADYREYCVGDLMEQICRSAADQLTTGANMLDKGILQNGILELQNYVAGNIGPCMDAFQMNDMDEDPDILDTYWELPDMLDLTDIKLVVSTGEISGFSLPDDPTDCTSNQDNNDQSFIPAQPLGLGPAWTATLASPAPITAIGPALFGSPIVGSGSLANSSSRDCTQAPCSSLTVTEDSPATLYVTALDLIADGPARLGNDLGSVTIEGGRAELRGGAMARRTTSAGDHEIAAGTAHFMILGEVDGEIRRIAGINASTITLSHSDATWQTSSFEIVILDEQGQRWIVRLPAGRWR